VALLRQRRAYSPLDQINKDNVGKLQVAWRWKADNFGPRLDANWEVTPLMAGGVLYFTAGIRRDVVAVDALTGETLWLYRYDEGERGAHAVRFNNRGVVVAVSAVPGAGPQLVALALPGGAEEPAARDEN
jgi:quinoprotein glucose dehydrogenase